MTWTYKEAFFYGDKINPTPGNSVRVILENDADEPVTSEFAYGYDGKKTKAEFVAMVRGEIRAHLQHLNSGAVGEDVTDVFEPV